MEFYNLRRTTLIKIKNNVEKNYSNIGIQQFHQIIDGNGTYAALKMTVKALNTRIPFMKR
jgi:creatinine amidohydrolase/Fe(II)-dependent formamide hydrolase-like protein